MLTQFKTLTDLMIAFQDPQTAIDHLKAIRWADGIRCPYCEHDKAYTLSRKNMYRCADCRKNFSVTVGTIFEDTKLPLRMWFGAIWLITSHPKGIASTTLATDLGITQKSAWFVLHRLRHAARTRSFNAPLKDTAEIDETFVGGKGRITVTPTSVMDCRDRLHRVRPSLRARLSATETSSPGLLMM